MAIREEILTAAAQVVGEHGIARATTRRIAEVAGCSEGSIYNHFASKHDLIAEAVHERMAAFPARALLLPEQVGRGEVSANLAELATLAIRFFSGTTPMLGAMMADPATTYRRALEMDAAGHGPRQVLRSLVDYLRGEQALGRVRPDACVTGAAMALVGGCLQQALLAQVWGTELLLLDDDAAAREISTTVIRGLEPAATTDDHGERP